MVGVVDRGSADSVSSNVTDCGWMTSQGGDDGVTDTGGVGDGTGRAAMVVLRTGSGGGIDMACDGAALGSDVT